MYPTSQVYLPIVVRTRYYTGPPGPIFKDNAITSTPKSTHSGNTNTNININGLFRFRKAPLSKKCFHSRSITLTGAAIRCSAVE